MLLRSLVLCSLLVGCFPKFPEFEPRPREPDSAAGASSAPAIVVVSEACRKACKTLIRLGCAGREGSPGYDEVYGTQDDVSCEVVCSDIERAARETAGLSIHPECVANAKDCREVTNCARISSGQVPP